ncbi:MAG: hypothetical protein AAB845_02835 [Patescibacteria group bacterium]
MAAKKSVIEVRGARVNNLKNIDVDIPRDALVVVTGLSGSGKSSLAFDTLFAEANRRFVESLSSYARNFLDGFEKPDVDAIHNLSPAISIDQKSVSRSPRSTVGTMTEVYDYLRVLYAKLGEPHCPNCGNKLTRRSVREILEEILDLPNDTALIFTTESFTLRGKNEKEALQMIQTWGYPRVMRDVEVIGIADAMASASGTEEHHYELVIDRLILNAARPDKERIIDNLQTAFQLGHGTQTVILSETDERRVYNEEYRCEDCEIYLPEFSPSHFSFNNPDGACAKCSGLGVTLAFDPELIIPNKNLSFLEGAVRPWSKMNSGRENGHGPLAQLLEAAKRLKISPDVSIKKLPKKHLETLLYGDGQAKGFEGIISLLEKKYKDTKSDHLRSDIEAYMHSQICGECEGKRLKKSSLAVLLGGLSIDDIAKQSIDSLLHFLPQL